MLKYIIIITVFVFALVLTADYGEFDVVLAKHDTCKGPKRKNCSTTTAFAQDGAYIKYDIYVNEEMTAVKGKLVGTLNDKEMIRLQIKNVCEHIFFKPLFTVMFNDDKERCGISKGHFVFRVDIRQMTNKFAGGKFIYGNWSFYSLFWNDNCNFHCDLVDIIITPKKSIFEKKSFQAKGVFLEDKLY